MALSEPIKHCDNEAQDAKGLNDHPTCEGA